MAESIDRHVAFGRVAMVDLRRSVLTHGTKPSQAAGIRCNHRVCRWCYVDEKEIRVQARELGVKPNLNGPPDLGAVRFHERRAAAAKVEAIETPLPEIAVPKRRPKLTPVAASENGVTAKA
jgi:hypothetical protein